MLNSKIIITVSCVLSSKRIPKKALEKIEGKETILHLLDRLQIGFNVVLCTSNKKDDNPLVEIAQKANVNIFRGSKENVIERLWQAAQHYEAEHIVRITADDLFVDTFLMSEAIKQHLDNDNDYTYMEKIPKGLDCEIIKAAALEQILLLNPKLNSTEYVSYYLKRPGLFKYSCYVPAKHYRRDYRLTMDYPEDLKLLKVIFSNLPKNFSNWELIDYLDKHPYLLEINKLPKISCYITNYNYGKFIDQAINSILYQTLEDWELIIIDDCSSEFESLATILKYSHHPKVRIIRNETNFGLNKTANKALGLAKGDYIIRLDADDILLPKAFEAMAEQLDNNFNLGIVYPNYYEWTNNGLIVKNGNETNHPAGAMIRKSCWNEIKYNADYRCQDGFDFYHKFKDIFDIGYYDKPCFVYRKHTGSLSTDNDLIRETREKMQKGLNNDCN